MQLLRPRAEPASSSSSIMKLTLANVKLSRVRGSGCPCLSGQEQAFYTYICPWVDSATHPQWFWRISPVCSPALKSQGKKWLCALSFFFPGESTKVSFAESQQCWSSPVDLLDTEDPTSFWAMLWSIVVFESILICLLELVFQDRLQSFTVPCFLSQQSVPSGCEWLCLTIYIDICVPV